MYDRILIPTDGSDCADEAARHAVRIAERFGSELHVLNAVETHEYVSAGNESVERQRDIVEEEGREAVESVSETASERGVETVEVVTYGSVHDVVLDYVEDEAIDLIVMGTHGRTGFERLLLGSNAAKTVRRSEVPVFTVPSRGKDESSYVYDSILVPTDGSPGSKAAVENAAGIARMYGSTVHVVYVIDIRIGSSTGVIPDVVTALEEEGERATREVAGEIEEDEETEVVTDVVMGVPGREITDYSREHGIDLIARGTHGRKGIGRLLLGSTAETVIRTSEVPVLTARTRSE
ncbi:MAG: universal stress protein [Halobacteria archaeon]|nr:universal stress protein [Halobacteria archaeon]